MPYKKPRGIEPHSMSGVNMPAKDEAFCGYEGVYRGTAGVDLLMLRIVLQNGLTLTRSKWINANAPAQWKLWHRADVFFGESPIREWLPTAPRGKYSAFPHTDLEEWLTRPELGMGMNAFEAAFTARQLEATMNDLARLQQDWADEPSRLKKYKLRKELRASIKESAFFTPVPAS